MKHIDVRKAFTQATLDEDVYVEQPHRFAKSGMVCKLRMALEGLKQSGHLWMKTNSDYLTSQLGFKRSPHDPCLFTKGIERGVVILGVYVDDILCLYSSQEMFDAKFGIIMRTQKGSRVTHHREWRSSWGWR